MWLIPTQATTHPVLMPILGRVDTPHNLRGLTPSHRGLTLLSPRGHTPPIPPVPTCTNSRAPMLWYVKNDF